MLPSVSETLAYNPNSPIFITGITVLPPEDSTFLMCSSIDGTSITIIGCVPVGSFGNNPPLKIYDYLRVGKPIVATNINVHTQILNDDIAVLVYPSPEFIAKGIVSVIDNPSYANTLGQNSRKFFENNYSTQEKIERTRQILNAVMRENL